MSTLKLTIFKPKVLKNGRHKIRVALCHKGVTSYISTQYIVEENQFRNGQVIKCPTAAMVNRKLRKLLDEYQDRLDAINNQEQYTCVQLKKMITSSPTDKATLTFQQVSKEYEDELIKKGSASYAKLIANNSRYFTEYAKGDFCIANITLQIIEGYSDYLRDVRHYSDTMNGMQMRNMRTIVNRAIKKRLVTYDVNPFVGFTIPAPAVREIDLSLDSFRKLKEIELTEKPLLVARDLFMISFFLGGMNLIDILEVDFRKDDVIYIRKKTRTRTQGTKTITFSIPHEAKDIASRWIDKKTGKLDFGYKYSYEHFRSYIGKAIRKAALRANINEKIMFYSARKSFAQYASELGIPDGIIDYCLGHSDKSKGVIRYYTKVRQKQADMAIARVIDYVNNPDKYKEYIELRSDIMLLRV